MSPTLAARATPRHVLIAFVSMAVLLLGELALVVATLMPSWPFPFHPQQ